MTDWIPLFQTLVWPIFIVLLLIIYRRPTQNLIRIIAERIRQGADFSVGPQGVSVGSAPKLKQEDRAEEKQIESLSPQELQSTYYLTHTAQFARIADGKDDYSITMRLDSDHPSFLKKVTKVAYHLHSSYYPRDVREVTSPDNHFELKFYAWGTFNLYAEVYTKGQEQPITAWRYINF